MGAFKKIEGRKVYIDMGQIHVPSWKIRDVQKAAHAKTRMLKRIDPFARCVGRKRIFETPDQLRAACDDYFKSQECFIYDKWGQAIKDPMTGEYIKSTHPLTLAGLGLHIGVSTTTLRRYKHIAESGTVPYEFAEVILEALQKIESYAERRGYDKDGQRGSQFVLERGFHWQSKKEEREIVRIKIETEMAKERLRMQQEEHKLKQEERKLKMKLMELGMDDGEDNEVRITVTRAKRRDEE